MRGRYKPAPEYWCPCCDFSLVTDGKKCHECGHRMRGIKDRLRHKAILREYDRRES